jgi:diadenosine tetraphosphate (Ap4A) HIT family hydrolase
MMLIARRHVAGPAHFDDREAKSFGPTLRHLEKVLEQVTGALRIYTAAMGESFPHFHAHMVPRYASMPKDAKAWAVFDLERAARADEISVDPAEIRRIEDAYRRALASAPIPLL